jgi:hypothetical protein
VKALVIAATALLGACSILPGSSPKIEPVAPVATPLPDPATSLIVEKEITPLTRAEVIAGINECEASNLRPVILSTKRRVNGQLIPAVVEVTCLPKIPK